jgi:hypothetical protein
MHPILLRITQLLVGRRASGFVPVAMCRGTRVWTATPVAFRKRRGVAAPDVAVYALDGGGRLQAVDEVRRALRVAGRGEDRAGV